MLDHLPTRIVSGILTASMTLSLLTGISGPGAAAMIEAAQQAKTRNQADVETAASKTDLEGAEIPMPLVLDKTSIGFTQGYEETEVTAYMTDIQYLGLLSIEEYAAFFPASLNLERVEYLSRDQRKYMATLDEPRRLSLRAQAEAKLKLKEQFVWEAMFGEEDYSDDLLPGQGDLDRGEAHPGAQRRGPLRCGSGPAASQRGQHGGHHRLQEHLRRVP